jgi:hypothetical protein
MIAPLSTEVLNELDRAEGGPVQAEDPRNHARYVVVSEHAYLQALPLIKNSLNAKSSEPLQWNEAKNARRCDLIKRKYTGGISAEDDAELNILQDEMYRYRAQVAPLPLEMLELLKDGLERRAESRRHSAAS